MNPILAELKTKMSSPPKCKDKFIASILNEYGNRLAELETAMQNLSASKVTREDVESWIKYPRQEYVPERR